MLSIIVPVFNEHDSITTLYEEIKRQVVEAKIKYEIIFIDDGSSDSSSEILSNIAGEDDNVKLISFMRNYGKSAALDAGFKACRGEQIITMDADLQDNPGDIPKFIKALSKYDLVVGRRKKRRDRITKIMVSRVYNHLSRTFFHLDIHDMNCGYKAMKREVVKDIELYGEKHRYIPAMVALNGFKVGEIQVEHRPRLYGRSKYNSLRIFYGLMDLLSMMFMQTFSSKPLHIFGFMGVITVLPGICIDAYLFYERVVLGNLIGHRPLLTLGVLLTILGIQFFSIGLLGEMIAGADQKARYIVKKR